MWRGFGAQGHRAAQLLLDDALAFVRAAGFDVASYSRFGSSGGYRCIIRRRSFWLISGRNSAERPALSISIRAQTAGTSVCFEVSPLAGLLFDAASARLLI